MKKKKKNHNSTPRRKRINREARLAKAFKWLNEYEGKNIIKGYAKWFGVDKLCAMKELKAIGVEFPEKKEEQIRAEIKAKEINRKKIKERKNDSILELTDSDDYFAYIAGYTSNGFPYGITYEEIERDESLGFDSANTPDTIKKINELEYLFLEKCFRKLLQKVVNTKAIRNLKFPGSN